MTCDAMVSVSLIWHLGTRRKRSEGFCYENFRARSAGPFGFLEIRRRFFVNATHVVDRSRFHGSRTLLNLSGREFYKQPFVLRIQTGFRQIRFLFNHTCTRFSTKGLEISLCDFTGTILVQRENLQ